MPSRPRVIHPASWVPPPGYSHGVTTQGRPLLFISGQVALDAAGRLVGAGDLGAQTTQVYRNLETVLATAGATFADVVKLTLFVVDFTPEKLAPIRAARDRFLGDGPRPASSLIGVAALFRPDILIEIEAIAELPPAA